MAADLNEATKNFIATAAKYRAMFELAERLENVGPLEQHIVELEARNAAGSDVEARLKLAKAELVDVEAKITAKTDELLEQSVVLAEAQARINAAEKKLKEIFS